MQQSPLHKLIKKSGQTQAISVQTANSHLQKVSHLLLNPESDSTRTASNTQN